MQNPLFHPELREMLAESDVKQMREFCDALHPARTAEFLEGLSPSEIWEILRHCDPPQRAEIFSYFDIDTQVDILRDSPREEMGRLVSTLPSDDRVDMLQDLDAKTAGEIITLLPPADRRDVLRLQAFPEGTCGSVMSTDFVRLNETMTVDGAIQEIGRQVRVQETVYYLYVLDEGDHLVGLVSAKQLLAAVGKGEMLIRDLMERDLITVEAFDKSREAAADIAKYDFVAVPVVDDEHRMLGIITYDDVIDLDREEATKHAYQMGAVTPMEEAYLEAPFLTIWRKRVVWLSILFIAELCTFTAMAQFQDVIAQVVVLALFVPLCISTGGNSGSQAATLITRSLAIGEVKLSDWVYIVRHELFMGLALGISLAAIGFIRAAFTPEDILGTVDRWLLAFVIAQSVGLICLVGTLTGSIFPLIFKRMGIDPAVASGPFVATFVDLAGIVIYFSIAYFWLIPAPTDPPPLVTLPAVSIEFALVDPTPENRQAAQDECHRALSGTSGLRVFYTTDSPRSAQGSDTMLIPSLSEESRYQVGCTMIFRNKADYDRFVASALLSDFLKKSGNSWHDRRVVFFDVEMTPETPGD